jgi:hypothetical protein
VQSTRPSRAGGSAHDSPCGRQGFPHGSVPLWIKHVAASAVCQSRQGALCSRSGARHQVLWRPSSCCFSREGCPSRLRTRDRAYDLQHPPVASEHDTPARPTWADFAWRGPRRHHASFEPSRSVVEWAVGNAGRHNFESSPAYARPRVPALSFCAISLRDCDADNLCRLDARPRPLARLRARLATS